MKKRSDSGQTLKTETVYENINADLAEAGPSEILKSLGDFSIICRICATTNDYLIPIFDGEGIENNLPDKIQKYLPIEVSESDALPQNVCYQCASTLLAWNELVQCCLGADDVLKTKLASSNPPNESQKINKQNMSRGKAPGNHIDKESHQSDLYRLTFSNYQKAQNILQSTDDVIKLTSNKLIDMFSLKVEDNDEFSFNGWETKPNLRETINSSTNPSPINLMQEIKIEYSKSDEDKLSQNSDVIDDLCNDFESFDDNLPLILLSKKKSTAEVFQNFYNALVKFRKHYNKHHSKLFDPNKSSETISKSENFDLSPDRDVGDLTLNNKRCNMFDEETRKTLNRVKKKIEGKIYYSCPICSKDLSSTHTYIFHMRIHSGEKPCVCHLCGKRFRVNTALHRHLKETHEKFKPFSCDSCDSKFVNKQNLVQHKRIHTGERPFVCSECGKSFKQSGSLYAHNKTHSDSYPFQCITCDAKFRYRSTLKLHIYKHTGEKPNICTVCGKSYRLKHELNLHLLTHSDRRPYTCPVCKLTFKQLKILKSHCIKVHDGYKLT